MEVKYIHSVGHGMYGVDPTKIPLCPICDQPMTVDERIEIQSCDTGFGPDMLRLVHYNCSIEEAEGD